MTPEGKVKKAVNKIFREEGVPLGHWWMPMPRGRVGISDYNLMYYGYFFAIECKAYPEEPTAPQYRYLRMVAENGGVAFWVNEFSVEQVRDNLRWARRCPRPPPTGFPHVL